MRSKKISVMFILLLLSISVVCQKINLKPMTEGPSLKFNDGTHKLSLYFMSGFDDSICIYLNKKFIQKLYAASLSKTYNAFLPIDIWINFKSNNNVLEIRKQKSKSRYYANIIKGYGNAVFYLDNDSSIVYTNRAPQHQ